MKVKKISFLGPNKLKKVKDIWDGNINIFVNYKK